jgi:hypothetical protein
MADGERKQGEAHSEEELKVTDRRLFTAEGELRDDAEPEQEEPRGSEDSDASQTVSPTEEQGFERRPVEEPRGVDFTMLINAMAEPALLFLGELPHPSTGEPTVDLERARIQIDMLDLLRVKCRGNLTPEEEGLLDRMLYQFRMLYVARANQPKT